MKTLDEIRTIIGQHREVLAEKYGVAVVGVFGSYVRGDQGERSDLDLLAEILHPVSLLELVGAEIYLSEVLGLNRNLSYNDDVGLTRHQRKLRWRLHSRQSKRRE